MRAKKLKPPEILRPDPLKKGDKVAFFSPSSHMGKHDPGLIEKGVEILKSWGLEVLPPEPERRFLYLAGTDQARAEEFTRLYKDSEIKGLFLTRGGYGSARMLPLLDGKALSKATPKPVVGFSDASALFAWMLGELKVVAFHGPALGASSLHNASFKKTSLEHLKAKLFQTPAPSPAPLTLLAGKAEKKITGGVTGGCLSVVVTTLGTPWEVETGEKILFLEDVGEKPYQIDRMLSHLKTAGKFDHLKALVFGYFTDCDEKPPGLLAEMLADFFKDTPFPVFQGLPAGHGDPNHTLILGASAEISLHAGHWTFNQD